MSGTTGVKRVKSGCITCRIRRVKCDGMSKDERKSCQTCYREDLLTCRGKRSTHSVEGAPQRAEGAMATALYRSLEKTSRPPVDLSRHITT